MKEAIDEVKNEVKAKLLLWKNIKSRKVKVIFIFLFLGLVGLKVFTTVLTFDWLAGFYPDFTDITKQGDNALLGVSSNEQKVFTRV